jgi:hypothetical protein
MLAHEMLPIIEQRQGHFFYTCFGASPDQQVNVVRQNCGLIDGEALFRSDSRPVFYKRSPYCGIKDALSVTRRQDQMIAQLES